MCCPAAGAFAKLGKEEREARIQALADAGRWQEAVELADLDPNKQGAPDWLLAAATDAMAPLTTPQSSPRSSHLRHAEESTVDLKPLQVHTHSWCIRIKDNHLMAQTVFRNLSRFCLLPTLHCLLRGPNPALTWHHCINQKKDPGLLHSA